METTISWSYEKTNRIALYRA